MNPIDRESKVNFEIETFVEMTTFVLHSALVFDGEEI